jgi:hypothetical protein
MGGKSKKKKKTAKIIDSNEITVHQDKVEKENRAVQKSISSFGARLHMIRHLLAKI